MPGHPPRETVGSLLVVVGLDARFGLVVDNKVIVMVDRGGR